jgi:hypothetical protein
MWFGGNSIRARKRAARFGHGWAPLMNDPTRATTNRTALLDTPDKLGAAVDQLHEFTVAEGRDPAAVEIQVETPHAGEWASEGNLERHRDHLAELGAVGVTSFVVKVPGDDPKRAIDELNRYGSEVIASNR